MTLSLEGKANRLSSSSAAISGWRCRAGGGAAVRRVRPGFGHRAHLLLRRDRRSLREHDYYSVGSGSPFARGSLKAVPRRAGCRRRGQSVPQALYDAADDDSATGGPDMTRRIFPVVYTVDARGPPDPRIRTAGSHGRRGGSAVPASRRPCGHRPGRGGDIMTMPVLRLARTDHQDKGRLRPQRHRAGIVQWSSLSTTRESCSSRRTRRGLCTRSVRSTTGSRSPRSASTTSSRICASPESGTPTCAAAATTAPT